MKVSKIKIRLIILRTVKGEVFLQRKFFFQDYNLTTEYFLILRHLEIRAVGVKKIILPFIKPWIFFIHIETGDRISDFMSSLSKRTLG